MKEKPCTVFGMEVSVNFFETKNRKDKGGVKDISKRIKNICFKDFHKEDGSPCMLIASCAPDEDIKEKGVKFFIGQLREEMNRKIDELEVEFLNLYK